MSCAANSLDIDVFASDSECHRQSNQQFASMRTDDSSNNDREIPGQGIEAGGEGEGEDGRVVGDDVAMEGVSMEDGSEGGRIRSLSLDSTTAKPSLSMGVSGGGVVSVDTPHPYNGHALSRLHGHGLLSAPPRLLGRVVGLLRR